MKFVLDICTNHVKGTKYPIAHLDKHDIICPGINDSYLTFNLSKYYGLITSDGSGAKVVNPGQQAIFCFSNIVIQSIDKYSQGIMCQSYINVNRLINRGIVKRIGAPAKPMYTEISRLLLGSFYLANVTERIMSLVRSQDIPMPAVSPKSDPLKVPNNAASQLSEPEAYQHLTGMSILCKMLTPIFGELLVNIGKDNNSKTTEVDCEAAVHDVFVGMFGPTTNLLQQMVYECCVKYTRDTTLSPASPLVKELYAKIILKVLVYVDIHDLIENKANLIQHIYAWIRYAIRARLSRETTRKCNVTVPDEKTIATEDGISWDMVDIGAPGGNTIAHMVAAQRPLPEGFNQWNLTNTKGNTVAHAAASCGHLPEGFNNWEWQNAEGKTVAHEAAYEDTLPEGFDQWHMSDNTGWTVAHTAAMTNHLPVGFTQWSLSKPNGWSVAHVAASHGCLPKDFTQWKISNHVGWSVAHEAAMYSRLPENFTRWDLVDDDGKTVAHVAAKYKTLPPDFDRWALNDRDGWTVAHLAAKYGRLPKNFDQWGLLSATGSTVAHVAVQYGYLPEGFTQWHLTTEDGVTVAHLAASLGRLPKNFDQWGLVNGKGVTVRDIYNAFVRRYPKSSR